MSEPVLLALLFADRVHTEDNGKKGIIGTFNRFFAPSFPIQFPPWAIYVPVTNLKGQHKFQIDLTHTETNQVILPLNGDMSVNHPDDVIELVMNLGGVLFPQ